MKPTVIYESPNIRLVKVTDTRTVVEKRFGKTDALGNTIWMPFDRFDNKIDGDVWNDVMKAVSELAEVG